MLDKETPRPRSVYWLPIAYLIAGIAWITGSDYVLGLLFRDDPRTLLFAGSLKGLLFVVVTAVLLYVVLYLRVGAPPSARTPRRSLTAEAWKPLVVFLVAGVGIAAVGAALYRVQAGEIRRDRAGELRAITDLKTAQIEFWLKDREQALEQVSRSPLATEALAEWLRGRSPDVGALLDRTLEGIRRSDEFEAVLLLAADGRLLKSAGTPFVPTTPLMRAMRVASDAPGVVASSLYVARGAAGDRVVLDHVVALRATAREGVGLFAFVVARSDPERYLFPLVMAWPSAETSGESLLLRREGGEIVVLTGLRHRAGPPSSLRLPISRHELASARVLLGERNAFEAFDYRRQPVLAVGRPVAGTDWFVMTKVDLAEVHAPLVRLMLMASGLVAAALIATAALVMLWWRGEKLRMDLELARSEERATALVEHFASVSAFANDIVLLLDEHARILEANDRAVSAYGYSRRKLLGMTVFDLRGLDVDEAAAAVREFDAVKSSGAIRFEARHRRKDGTSFPVEVSSRRMDVGGRPYVQSIIRDISERRVHEQQIAEISAERDRLLQRLELQFERMPVGCVVSGSNLRILQVNTAFERMFGYSREELGRSQAWTLIVPPELRDSLQARLAPLVTGDASTSITLVNENLTKAGPRITCRWTNTPLRGPAGEFMGMLSMCEDITQRLETERALRESEERFRALAEVSPVVIFRTDVDGRCTYVNARWCDIAGQDSAAALGTGWMQAVHPDDRARVAAAWDTTLAGGKFRMEYRLLWPDGHVVWLLGQAAPEFDMDGRVAGYVGTVTDISDVKATELELQQSRAYLEERVQARTRELAAAKERAERADRVKSTFLSTMSHELRTPLNSIMGFTDVVLQGLSGPLTEEQQRHLGIVRDSSAHLLDLINDVLDLSRIEAGQLRLEIGPVELPDLLRRRLQGFEAEAARKGLSLTATIGDGVDSIQSDGKRVSQILANLLSNAVKFTDHGEVTLAARAVDGTIEVAISDTGPGIGPEDMAHLFTPFTQLSTRMGRTHEGTGLGLAISGHLAQALGGRIRVVSRPGGGSCFTLVLPLASPPPEGSSETGLYIGVSGWDPASV